MRGLRGAHRRPERRAARSAPPFTDFLRWLRDQDAAERWADTLDGFTKRTPLPYDRTPAEAHRTRSGEAVHHRRVSDHFTDALTLRRPGFDRVKVMDRIGLAAALFMEDEPEQGAAAAHQALDEVARVDSTLVASRLKTLLDAARPYRTAAVHEVRTRAADLAAARPTTVAA
ncbi:hypothetical protein AB0K80_33675 [Streptomyces sp. NPDC052682]|uniref:hypothetical protein n=1 Tax=Streptomyces sp. NPDC052682 TaxID=3154954 RepID=UPI00344213D8